MAVNRPTSARPSGYPSLHPSERAGPLTAKTRRTWIDATKGVAILLVVVGHTVRGLFNAQILPSDGAWGFVDRAIYAFHMPLFFFLSGLFTLPAKDEHFIEFLRRRLIRLGYPYLIWATLQTLVQVVLSRYTNHPTRLSELWTIIYLPPMQFWFLYALFLQVLVIGLLSKLGLSRGAIFGIGLVLYLTSTWVPVGSWLPLYQAREALVYTSLGVLLGEPSRLRAIEQQPATTYAAITCAGLLAVIGALTLKLEQHYLAALLVALLGSAGTLSLCLLLERATFPSLARVRAHVVTWGTASLAIFVAHTLASAAVRIALQKVLHVENPPLHLALGILVGIYVPLTLYILSQRYKLPYLFEWPTSRNKPQPPREAPVQG